MIVSDASPIIGLSRVSHLHLLPAVYNQILIPPAVRDDAIRQGMSAVDIDRATWIAIRSPRDSAMVDQLRHVERLDLGEAETITLASEFGLGLVIYELSLIHI